ncbi:MAG: glycosyltransferase family 2 protein [Desulfobacteraceae bacterium]
MAVITRDEEDRLPACLSSVAFAGDLVVVDSGSTDSTVLIAREMGARVFEEPWRGFSAQKQFAVDQCLNDWVLVLDADESLPPETARAAAGAVQGAKEGVTAFSFRRKNLLHGRWIRRCGWWPDRVVRLVDRRAGAFDGRLVHEGWVVRRGEVKALDEPIEHRSFRSYSDLAAKMEAYSDLAARAMFEEGRSINPLYPVLHGGWMFFRTYFLELGFLVGFDGLVISVMNAGGSFLKYAKLLELRRYAEK